MGLKIDFIGFYVSEVAQYFICLYSFELSNGERVEGEKGRERGEGVEVTRSI